MRILVTSSVSLVLSPVAAIWKHRLFPSVRNRAIEGFAPLFAPTAGGVSMALHTMSVKKTFTLKKAVVATVVPEPQDDCLPSEGHYDHSLGKIVKDEMFVRFPKAQSEEEKAFARAERELQDALDKLRPKALRRNEKCQELSCHRYGCTAHLRPPVLSTIVRQMYEKDIERARMAVAIARAACKPGMRLSF